jgi:hypothetical protein
LAQRYKQERGADCEKDVSEDLHRIADLHRRRVCPAPIMLPQRISPSLQELDTDGLIVRIHFIARATLQG